MSRKGDISTALGGDQKLGDLIDWIVESACEDDGYVGHLAGIAARIYGVNDPLELRGFIRAALRRLVDQGLLVVGPYDEMTVVPIFDDELQALLDEDSTWDVANIPPGERIGYGSTAGTERLDRLLSERGDRASERIYE